MSELSRPCSACSGGPFAWALQLNMNYALASHACFPHAEARSSVLPGWHGFTWGLGTVNMLALAPVARRRLLSWRSWQATSEEHQGGAGALLEAGEGRTRFLAACGIDERDWASPRRSCSTSSPC